MSMGDLNQMYIQCGTAMDFDTVLVLLARILTEALGNVSHAARLELQKGQSGSPRPRSRWPRSKKDLMPPGVTPESMVKAVVDWSTMIANSSFIALLAGLIPILSTPFLKAVYDLPIISDLTVQALQNFTTYASNPQNPLDGYFPKPSGIQVLAVEDIRLFYHVIVPVLHPGLHNPPEVEKVTAFLGKNLKQIIGIVHGIVPAISSRTMPDSAPTFYGYNRVESVQRNLLYIASTLMVLVPLEQQKALRIDKRYSGIVFQGLQGDTSLGTVFSKLYRAVCESVQAPWCASVSCRKVRGEVAAKFSICNGCKYVIRCSFEYMILNSSP